MIRRPMVPGREDLGTGLSVEVNGVAFGPFCQNSPTSR